MTHSNTPQIDAGKTSISQRIESCEVWAIFNAKGYLWGFRYDEQEAEQFASSQLGAEGYAVRKMILAPTPGAEPVARLHVTPTDTYPDVRVEVLDGSGLQPANSPYDVYLAPITSKVAASREAVARIIDPLAWEQWDEIRQPNNSTYGLHGQPEGRMGDKTCARWIHKEGYSLNGTCTTSLEKADAILAIPTPPTTATGGAFTLDQIVDVLHCCDDEARMIVNRIAQPHGLPSQCPDGVQVLDDAETIIRAAFRVLGSSPGVQSAWKTFAASPKSEPATTGDQTPEREALERAASDFKRLHDGAPNAWVKQQALHAHNRCKAVLGGDA